MSYTLARLLGSLGSSLTDASHRMSHRGRVPDGMNGVRDQDNPCLQFYWGTPGAGGCQTDGHYLCKSCMWSDKTRADTAVKTRGER